MRSNISILRARSFHLRNLSLFHCANAWSVMFRGYRMADYEFYGYGSLPGWVDLSFDHVLKPKPRKYRSFLPFIKPEFVQLTLEL